MGARAIRKTAATQIARCSLGPPATVSQILCERRTNITYHSLVPLNGLGRRLRRPHKKSCSNCEDHSVVVGVVVVVGGGVSHQGT